MLTHRPVWMERIRCWWALYDCCSRTRYSAADVSYQQVRHEARQDQQSWNSILPDINLRLCLLLYEVADESGGDCTASSRLAAEDQTHGVRGYLHIKDACCCFDRANLHLFSLSLSCAVHVTLDWREMFRTTGAHVCSSHASEAGPSHNNSKSLLHNTYLASCAEINGGLERTQIIIAPLDLQCWLLLAISSREPTEDRCQRSPAMQSSATVLQQLPGRTSWMVTPRPRYVF